MKLNILLTPELKAKMPSSVKVPFNYGQIDVMFPRVGVESTLVLTGDNAIIEGDDDVIVKWLKEFDEIAVGSSGCPQFEQFEIMHIKEEL